MSKSKTKITTNPDGSADLMSVYSTMFAQTSKKSKVNIVEGHIPTIHMLMNQSFFREALERGVKVDILYTGSEPSNDTERRMYEEMKTIVKLTKTPHINITPKNLATVTNVISQDMVDIYNTGMGVTGVTNRLMQTLVKNGVPMDYVTANDMARNFERRLLEGKV